MIHWPVDVELRDRERVIASSVDPTMRAAVLGLFIACGLWCQAKFSDGLIPKDVAHALLGGIGEDSDVVKASVRCGLLVDSGDSYEVRNFTKKAKPKAERLASIAAKQERQRVWVSTRRQNVDANKCRHVDTGSDSDSLSGSDSLNKRSRDPEGDRKPRARRDRGTRLPPDWVPKPETVEYIRKRGHDPDALLDGFRDHWWSSTTDYAWKLDWDAAARVWARREKSSGSTGPPEPRTSTAEEIKARAEARMRAREADADQSRRARVAQAREPSGLFRLAGGDK